MKNKMDYQAYQAAVSALRRIANDELLQFKEGIDPERLVKVLLKRLESATAQTQAQGQSTPTKPATAQTQAQAQSTPTKPATVTPIQGDLKLLDSLLSPDTNSAFGGADAVVISKNVDYRATVSVQKAVAMIALSIMGESLNEEEQG